MIIKKSEAALKKAVSVLKKGGVVICPTDTVYGFLADAGNKKAVAKIYKIKNRPKNKPLPVFISSIKIAKELAEIDIRAKKMFKKYWPGKYTFILKLKVIKLSSYQVYGVGKNTVALRIPKHAFLQKLLKKFGKPLVQTSVNVSGEEPLNSAQSIIEVFGKNRLVGLVIDGGIVKNNKSSKIIDLTCQNVKIIRK